MTETQFKLAYIKINKIEKMHKKIKRKGGNVLVEVMD